jgi:hypothetical protein
LRRIGRSGGATGAGGTSSAGGSQATGGAQGTGGAQTSDGVGPGPNLAPGTWTLLCDDCYDLATDPTDFRHVLVTFHSAWGWTDTKWNMSSGVMEPKDGMGTSHYVIPVSGTTWCVISQDTGIFRTTTAGRTGGTAALQYRDGTISTAAWTKVDDLAHAHGSHQNLFVGGAWYATGSTSAKKSTDDGGWSWSDPGTPGSGGTWSREPGVPRGLLAAVDFLFPVVSLTPERSRCQIACAPDRMVRKATVATFFTIAISRILRATHARRSRARLLWRGEKQAHST